VVLTIVLGAGMWRTGDIRSGPEQVIMFNVVTLGIVAIGVIALHVALLGLNLVGALLLLCRAGVAGDVGGHGRQGRSAPGWRPMRRWREAAYGDHADEQLSR
jgi:hypothetical protein